MELKEILNSGVVNANFNGHWKQEVMFINEKNEKYRIVINHSGPNTNLYKWSDANGWLFIVERKTKEEYGIDICYHPKERIAQNTYVPIIKDLKRFIQNF